MSRWETFETKASRLLKIGDGSANRRRLTGVEPFTNRKTIMHAAQFVVEYSSSGTKPMYHDMHNMELERKEKSRVLIAWRDRLDNI